MPPATSTQQSFAASDPGFEPLPVEELLASHCDLIDRIQLTFGLDAATFAQTIRPVIRAYASFVHLVPATAREHFARPAGLFAIGLEVGFYALQATDAHVFSGQATISIRRLLEPRWRHATFLAGLCCEVHRALSSLVVTDPEGAAWPAYRQPLVSWLEARHASRYFVHWRPRTIEARGVALFALPHILERDTLQDLDVGSSSVVPHLLACIGGLPVCQEPNVLDGLVKRSLALVIDRDLRSDAGRYGKAQFGSHLERYFVDALRRLAEDEPTWRPNRERSRVWHARDGVFLAWPQCAVDIQSLFEADRLPGIPKSPETVLEVLLEAGIAVARGPLEPTWVLTPPNRKDAVTGVKLASAALLWPSSVTEPGIWDGALTSTEVSPSGTADIPPSAEAIEVGGQLSLLDPKPASNGPSLQPRKLDNQQTASVSPRLSFQAPLRLSHSVRIVLAAIIDTLNGGAQVASACTVANGIFVPLTELERRGLQPALALRALGDLQLLVHDGAGPPTIHRDFGGASRIGLVLDPRCVVGLDLAAFIVPAEGV